MVIGMVVLFEFKALSYAIAVRLYFPSWVTERFIIKVPFWVVEVWFIIEVPLVILMIV